MQFTPRSKSTAVTSIPCRISSLPPTSSPITWTSRSEPTGRAPSGRKGNLQYRLPSVGVASGRGPYGECGRWWFVLICRYWPRLCPKRWLFTEGPVQMCDFYVIIARCDFVYLPRSVVFDESRFPNLIRPTMYSRVGGMTSQLIPVV